MLATQLSETVSTVVRKPTDYTCMLSDWKLHCPTGSAGRSWHRCRQLFIYNKPMDLLLHDNTQRALKAFVTKPAHAVLLVGPVGSGKSALAQLLAGQLLGVDVSRLAS